MTTGFRFWIGIDWGSENHQVCILDGTQVVLERSVPHTGAGIRAFVQALLALGSVEEMAVGIEAPHGAIIETLVERGAAVFAINPKQLDRFRDRHTVAGAKDDRRDAYVLADSLRTDLASFRRVTLDDPLVVQIRELVRVHEDLVQERVALGNRLHGQLNRFFPAILELGEVYDDPWIWTLLEQAPTPVRAMDLSLEAIAAILKSHKIRRLDAKGVTATLAAEALPVAPGVVDAASKHISLLIPRLRLNRDQLKHCMRELDRLLDALAPAPREEKREHRDVAILRSLPGVGTIVSATMLAEAQQPLEARDYRTLRAQAGVAPVTRATGKRSGVHASVSMRYACNSRLRNAVYHWTMNNIRADARSKDHYARLRSRGHGHARALRGVADRLLRLMIAMLRNGSLYDASRRLPKTDNSSEVTRTM